MPRWKLSRDRALARLKLLKEGFREHVNSQFGFRAKDCGTCLTPCCADAEFVNVNITRLEAEAMLRVLSDTSRFSLAERAHILDRARNVVETYDLLAATDSFATTYACPLFEPGTGCLVHRDAKPAPCIHHGCYERAEDLPDEASLVEVERSVADLNRDLYGPQESQWGYRTIPVWLVQLERRKTPAGESSSALPSTGARG